MRARAVTLALTLVGLLDSMPASAKGCTPCLFWGGCIRDGVRVLDCTPSEVRCRPNRGILAFNGIPPNEPYWILNARRSRTPGRLPGVLRVRVDNDDVALVPGFPGRRCDRYQCSGRNAQFVGEFGGDRLTGTARYRDGATCEFAMDLVPGYGTSVPNGFVCRDPAGQVLSQGALRVQLIRLRGCRQ